MISEPRIYTTSEWGAEPPTEAFEVTTPTHMILHHTASENRTLLPGLTVQDHQRTVQRAFELARSIQEEHIYKNGWADSGQHFTISREGIILEGRHGSLAAAKAGHCIRGAHAHDEDTGADFNYCWGVEHEGTYTSAEMPAAQWHASIHLHAWLAMQCHIDSINIEGHRDTGCNTQCCGDWFEKHIPEFQRAVHNLILTAK